MNLKSPTKTGIVILGIAASLSAPTLRALPVPQTKPSHSDEDINAIGHRNLAKGTNLYSLDKETQIGKQLAQEVERSSNLMDDPVVAEYINRITQKIAQNSDVRFPIAIAVIDSDDPASFALPGGFQYVNTGLILQTENEAELAGMLARGIAHTALRTSATLATKGELLQLASAPLAQGHNLAIPLVQLQFRRDAERAADYFGLQYLYKAGYDPACLPHFIERTAALSAGSKPAPQALSAFPPAPERAEAMRREIAKILPHRDGAIANTVEFQEIQEHLRAWKAKHTLNPDHDPTKPALRIRTSSPAADPPAPRPN